MFMCRDLAKMRSDGYFEIVGRKKDVIIRGGENIFPKEVLCCCATCCLR